MLLGSFSSSYALEQADRSHAITQRRTTGKAEVDVSVEVFRCVLQFPVVLAGEIMEAAWNAVSDGETYPQAAVLRVADAAEKSQYRKGASFEVMVWLIGQLMALYSKFCLFRICWKPKVWNKLHF